MPRPVTVDDCVRSPASRSVPSYQPGPEGPSDTGTGTEAMVSRPMICPPAPAPALREGVRLYSRHHIDLLRVAGALCRR
ncbi:putative leader peptide [Streptomyces asiaticus]